MNSSHKRKDRKSEGKGREQDGSSIGAGRCWLSWVLVDSRGVEDAERMKVEGRLDGSYREWSEFV